MTEKSIDGALVLRWLRTDDADAALLVGCEVDDDSQDLAVVVGVDLERQILTCRGGRRIPFARLRTCQLVVALDHPLGARTDACITPEERKETALRAQLGPGYRGAINIADLEAVHAAEMARRARHLPDPDSRFRQFEALKANGLHLQGVGIAETWRDLARASGQPWGDIGLNLAKCLRETGQVAKAAEAAKEALDGKGSGATPRQRAMLATTRAASLIDKFERKGGEPADLVAAWNSIKQAWAIEAEHRNGGEPHNEEMHRVYGRLKAIGPEPR